MSTLQTLLSPLKRRLHNYANEVQNIAEYGRAASKDSKHAPLFKGMFRALDRYYTKFESTWEECLDLVESADASVEVEGGKSKTVIFPLESDSVLQKATRKFYYEANSIYEGLSCKTLLSQPSSGETTTIVHDRSDLPKIPLPKFDGELLKWPNFRDTFSTLVNEDDAISSQRKFIYLKSALSGSALAVIANLPTEKSNFSIAWQALLDAYDNKRVLASTYLNQVLSFKPIQGTPSIQSLKEFLAHVSDSVSAFRLLAIKEESQFILFFLAIRCLDSRTREQFEMSNKETFPTFDKLTTFIRDRITSLELIAAQSGTSLTTTNQSSTKVQLPKQNKIHPSKYNTALFTQQEHRKQPYAQVCIVCKIEPHGLSKCAKFLEGSVPQRMEWLRHFKGCKNCLSYSHSANHCTSKWNCRFCHKRHNTYLHPDSSQALSPRTNNVPPTTTASQSTNTEPSTTSMPCCLLNQDSDVILGTAVAEILDARGIFQQIRLVVDCGSQHSFISQSCIRRLGLSVSSYARRITGIGQTAFEGARGKVSCVLRPKGKNTVSLTTNAIVIKNITTFLPNSKFPLHLCQKLMNFELADPKFFQSAPVDFLLGAELFGDIWNGSAITVDPDCPKLYPSIFGNIVMGKFSSSNSSSASTSLFVCSQGDDLRANLQRFWEVEEPRTIVIKNPEEERGEEYFQRTHYRLPSGRYVVRLPFKEEITPDLTASMFAAQKRFYNLEGKLKTNDELRQQYHEFMQEFIDLGHMSPTSIEPKFVIPHHSIVKEDRNKPKLRVVFDGSASTPNGSLNEHLLPGEKLQKDIKHILLNFRAHAYVFVADIVKMFRSIDVDQQDRPYQCIKWRFDPSDALQTYQLNTVVYGLSCSPFLALRVIRQLQIDEGHRFPLAAKIMDRDIYVDDFATGSNSLSTALELQRQLIEILKSGGFTLSKWASNSQCLLDAVAESPSTNAISLDGHEANTSVKILGIEWNPTSDEFSYRITQPAPTSSKRGVLSNIAKIFDPLGFLAPTVFLLKTFMQELWKEGLSWDQKITPQLQLRWDTVMNQLSKLSSIKVPRFVGCTNDCQFQVVGFSDASTKGYCAAIYLRNISATAINVALLIAKTRLAPVKTLSVPRLELCGALLLAELCNSVNDFLRLLPGELLEPNFFVDSSIVLSWLHTPPYKLKTYVASRVTQITQLTAVHHWKHIDSEMNPSDCGSRGLLPGDLVNHPFWFNGPPWLKQPVSQWPTPTFNPLKELPELKVPPVSLAVTLPHDSPFLEWMKRFSSFFKLLRVVAILLRGIENRRNCPNFRTGPLSLSEINSALICCITAVQHHQLIDVQRHGTKEVPEVYANLAPFQDGMGIWRVGGRIRHSQIPFNRKHPILLPAHSHFSVLLTDHYHRSYLHPGPSTLQAMIQTKYWIVPSLRRLVRQRTFMCLRCFKLNAKPHIPPMGDLPEYRLQNKRAFAHTGVDFAGPFCMRESLRRKASTSKIYLALFVCMETKALHLEAVTQLSADAFLAAFDRFTARRGLPSEMYSDCGLNFVGASNKLQELYQWYNDPQTKDQIIRSGTRRGVKWNFNPPHAPHFGGLWEAGVRSVKRLMSTSTSDTPLSYEEYATLFARFEAILNSRPLCPLSSDPEETDYLSPGHFLVGGPLLAQPEPSLLDVRENRLDRWQLVKRMSQEFWTRWNLEYLATLQKRAKWTTPSPNLQAGTLVLVKENHAPVMSWPLARIVDTHPGRDNIIRVVSIKKGASVFKRPVVDLVPLLPLSSPAFDS